jgi:methyl-accepting chemotaxis protein
MGSYMTLKNRFRAIFSLLVAMILVLVGIVTVLINNQDHANKANDYRYESYNLGLSSKLNSDLLTKLARQYVITLDAKYLNEYLRVVDMLEGKSPWPNGESISYSDRLQTLGFTEQEFSKLDESNSLSLGLVEIEEKAFAAIESFVGRSASQLTPEELQQWQQAIALIYSDEYERFVTSIKSPVDDFFAMLDERTGTSVSNLESSSDRLGIITLLFSLLVMIILVLAYFIINSRVIKPTLKMVNEAKMVAQGDLTRNIRVEGKDELAMLAQAFNDMIQKLSSLLVDIRQQSNHANQHSTELNHISESTSNSSIEQSAAVEMISTSVYENSTACKEIASTCTQAVVAVGEIDSQTQSGKQVVSDCLMAVNTLSDELAASMTRLEELVKSVADVTNIVDVINSIAEQTNLLALNAAIEAARAGEMGRGFAVVADEVRTLAQRTQTSTSEITEKISLLETVCQDVVARVQNSDQGIKKAVEYTNNADQSLTQIADYVGTINDMTTSIAAAAEEQAQVTDDISERLIIVRDGTNAVKDNIQTVATTATQLKDVSIELNNSIEVFKVS